MSELIEVCELCGEQDAVDGDVWCNDCASTGGGSWETEFVAQPDDVGVRCDHEDYPCCGC